LAAVRADWDEGASFFWDAGAGELGRDVSSIRMAKGLAEATDMVDGALFNQCKSDKGDEVIASCGKAGM